jgi:hypothetical protein
MLTAMGSALYVLGGDIGNAISASVLKFDSAQDSWSEVAPMPAPREIFASCAYKSDIYVFGGYVPLGVGLEYPQESVFKFDTEANEWSTLAPMPLACACHSANLIDKQFYVVSEYDVQRFDIATSEWSVLAHPNYRRDISFVLADCLYTAGGGDRGAGVERYDVATNTCIWTPVADMPEGRRYYISVHAVGI